MSKAWARYGRGFGEKLVRFGTKVRVTVRGKFMVRVGTIVGVRVRLKTRARVRGRVGACTSSVLVSLG